MSGYDVTAMSDDVIINPDGMTISVRTADGLVSLNLPLAVAEALSLRVRAAADDVQRLRQDRGDQLSNAIASADRPPLDTVGCQATPIKDGRILLQFRHPSAATTDVFVSRQGASILAHALFKMAGIKRVMPR
jgi:3,4-dihydroxy-2-butanone 4-phosphate synthase